MNDTAIRDETIRDETSGPDSQKDPTSRGIHPVDIRISVPFVRSRFYVTLHAGRERRKVERRDLERTAYPLLTFGNILFSFGVATLFIVVALAVLIFRSAIIQ